MKQPSPFGNNEKPSNPEIFRKLSDCVGNPTAHAPPGNPRFSWCVFPPDICRPRRLKEAIGRSIASIFPAVDTFISAIGPRARPLAIVARRTKSARAREGDGWARYTHTLYRPRSRMMGRIVFFFFSLHRRRGSREAHPLRKLLRDCECDAISRRGERKKAAWRGSEQQQQHSPSLVTGSKGSIFRARGGAARGEGTRQSAVIWRCYVTRRLISSSRVQRRVRLMLLISRGGGKEISRISGDSEDLLLLSGKFVTLVSSLVLSSCRVSFE